MTNISRFLKGELVRRASCTIKKNLYMFYRNNFHFSTKNVLLFSTTFCYSCALLESLGDNSSYEVRNAKFEEADTDGDGWITYDEFLPVRLFLIIRLFHNPHKIEILNVIYFFYNQAIYNFNPPVRGTLQGLGKLCFEASENIKFVSNLTVGEQLEYGLF